MTSEACPCVVDLFPPLQNGLVPHPLNPRLRNRDRDPAGILYHGHQIFLVLALHLGAHCNETKRLIWERVRLHL